MVPVATFTDQELYSEQSHIFNILYMSYLWQDKSNSDDSNNSATAVSKNNLTKKKLP